MRLEDIEFKHQRALMLTRDIVFLISTSEHSSSEDFSKAMARAAITNAALFLECSSNSCIQALNLPSKLVDELDKLPTLSKLDYYLFATTGTHIDRGCRVVELAADILRLRDYVVHPKPRGGTLRGTPGTYYVDFGTAKALEIPLDTNEWNAKIARSIAVAAFAFAKMFFLEWSKKDKGQLTMILAGTEKAMIHRGARCWFEYHEDEIELIRSILPDALDIFDIRIYAPDA